MLNILTNTSFKYNHFLGCHAKYIVVGNYGVDVFFKIDLIRNGEITHKAGEQATNQVRGAKRSKLVERILKEKLTAHDVHIESLNK